MENFVDRIIETDRKAREIIEAAQQEKENILAGAEAAAREKLALRQAENAKKMQALDAQYAARMAEAVEESDRQYIAAKHKLDDAFESGRTHWLKELTDGILSAE